MALSTGPNPEPDESNSHFHKPFEGFAVLTAVVASIFRVKEYANKKAG
jgi:hypothetical protein